MGAFTVTLSLVMCPNPSRAVIVMVCWPLLRLQGRRLQSDEAKAAVDESVRRIRTIALVHETLSREVGDDIAFGEILRPLARMAEETLQSPDRPVRFHVSGEGGKLPAATATPLAVVLTELLQNAVDH